MAMETTNFWLVFSIITLGLLVGFGWIRVGIYIGEWIDDRLKIDLFFVIIIPLIPFVVLAALKISS